MSHELLGQWQARHICLCSLLVFPLTGVRALCPIWRWLAAGGCSPNTKSVCASAVLMSKSTRKGNKGWKRKGKVQSGSKDGFEVQPRSGDQEVRAVIAAGYQFPFLFWDRPQPAGVCPSERRQEQHSPLQESRSCWKMKSNRNKTALCISNAEAKRKYLEHV